MPVLSHGRQFQGFLLGIIGMVIFGLTLPVTRLAIIELDPIFVGLGRAVLAAALAGFLLWVTGQRRPSQTELPWLALTSLGVALGFPLCATLAMQYAPAAHGGIVLAILPLATAVAAVILAGERPSLGFWLWSLTGAAAVLIYTLTSEALTGLQWADLLLLGAVMSAAMGYAAGGRLSHSLGGWQVICWALVLALPVVLPIVLLASGPVNWQASATAWAAFLYVALFSQFLGFFAWNRGMVLAGIAKVGQVQLLQSFVTLLAAAVLLGESITAWDLGFASLIAAIVALGRRSQVRRLRS